ncbi:hypothetical protein Tco_1410248, partial [Tanacetum coccineum]
MSFLTSIYSLGNIMDGVDIEDLTIEQYLMLTQESQTPKNIEDMTIVEYLEYEKKVNENYISDTKSYLPTNFGKSAESDYDSEDMEEEVEYMTGDEVVMSEQEESNHGNEVDKADDNTSNTARCRILKELSPGRPDSLSPDRRGLVKRWHVCEPIHVTYYDGSGEDYRMWPTCDPDLKFCFGYNEVFGVNEQGTLRQWICFRDHERRAVKGSYIGFADFLQVRYGQQKIDDTTRERRYYEWVAQNYEYSKHRTLTSTTLNDHYPYNTNNPIPTPQGHHEQGENKAQPIRPRPCNYSFEEWLKIRIGHNNLHESDREFIFNEWILDSYDVKEEYAREIGNPYSRRFDEYNRVFNNEIEHLSNEYIFKNGKER